MHGSTPSISLPMRLYTDRHLQTVHSITSTGHHLMDLPYSCPSTTSNHGAADQWQQFFATMSSSPSTALCVASFWGLGVLPLLATCVYQACAWQRGRRRWRALHRACADDTDRLARTAMAGGNGVHLDCSDAATGHQRNSPKCGRTPEQATPYPPSYSLFPPHPLPPLHIGHSKKGGGVGAYNHSSTNMANDDEDSSSSTRALKAFLLPLSPHSVRSPLLRPSPPPPWPVLFTRETLLLLHLLYLIYGLLTLLDPSLHPSSSFAWQHALVVRLGGMVAWMLVVEGEEAEAAARGSEKGQNEGGRWGLVGVYGVGTLGAWWTILARGSGKEGTLWWGEMEVSLRVS